MIDQKDILLEAFIKMNSLDRELYILQVLMYRMEKEIIANGYYLPTTVSFAEIYPKVEDILENLVKTYRDDFLLSHKRKTKEQMYLFLKCNYDLDKYIDDYMFTKGRLALSKIHLIYELPIIKRRWKQLKKFIRNLFRKG